jgi:hypothetical protein
MLSLCLSYLEIVSGAAAVDLVISRFQHG